MQRDFVFEYLSVPLKKITYQSMIKYFPENFLSFVQDSFTRTVTWHIIIDCEKLVHVSVIDYLLVGSWRTWRRVLTCQYPAMSRQALQRMWKTTMWWWSLDCLSSSSLNTVRTVWYNSWWGRSKTPCSAIYESRDSGDLVLRPYTRVNACRKLRTRQAWPLSSCDLGKPVLRLSSVRHSPELLSEGLQLGQTVTD